MQSQLLPQGGQQVGLTDGFLIDQKLAHPFARTALKLDDVVESLGADQLAFDQNVAEFFVFNHGEW